MALSEKKVIIIGGGIAGLCAAVYARKCGYQVEVLEQQDAAGGLATSWKRGDYTFETCLHWLLGTNPHGKLHAQWQEVFDIEKLIFIDPEEYVRLETENGESLSIYADVDRMERELLKCAPEDEEEIKRLAADIRLFSDFPMPDPNESWPGKWLTSLHLLPYLPLLRQWSSLRIEDYGRRFTNPLLRAFFESGEMARLSVLPLLFSLAWMSKKNAAYPIGGSRAVIRGIVERLKELGGQIRFKAKVSKILVENDAAIGVQLTSGEILSADWVISAADGHTSIYRMLGGRYTDREINKLYCTLETFPSYLQVSLGVAKDLSQEPAFVTRLLDKPLALDPETQLGQVSFRFFHFDPTFAPPGKTAVTCFLPTRNFEYWLQLQEDAPAQYQAEKNRIAEAVIGILERSVRDVREAIEVVDVSTPATVIACTGNWKGSMEGWLLTPETGLSTLPKTLPGLRHFMMVGHWTMPGGGLPSGLMTARAAVQSICKQDHVTFLAHPSTEDKERIPTGV